MSILIISLPRTGSTELGRRLSLENKLQYGFEPFNPLTKTDYDLSYSKKVIKTIIFHKPVSIEEDNRLDWLIDLSGGFKQTILLSRRDLVACAESWSYLNYKMKTTNFTSVSSYVWEKTPNYETAFANIKKWDNEINYLSEKIKSPVTYYEDIYDLKDPNRLRRGNRTDFVNKII
jgi:hypothetical protein